MSTVDIDKADIIAAVSNDYYDSLKNEAPYINMKFEELGAVCRDFATKDVDDLLATHRTHLKAELLAKMPKRKSDEWCVGEYKDFGQGFNKAITEITKLVENL